MPSACGDEVHMFFFGGGSAVCCGVLCRRDNGTGNYTGSPCAVVSQSSKAALASSFACRSKTKSVSDS